MAELALIYRKLIGVRVRAQLEYRASFVMNLLTAFLMPLTDFVAILVLFTHVTALAGWSVAEVAFLYAVTGIAFGITDLLIGHLDYLPSLIRSGTFDVILTRPLGTLFQVVTIDFSFRRVGRIAQAVAVLVIAIARLHVEWNAGRVIMLGLMIAGAVVIFLSVWIAMVTITFWTVDAVETVNAFTSGGNFLTQYPLGVFGVWVRRLLAFVIPMAFVNYFPSLYVLGKQDALGFPVAMRFMSPIVAAITAIIAAFVWRFAVRHYQSTGS